MASNSTDPPAAPADDDDYQARYDEDDDDDERTIEEEEQLNSDEEENELDDLQAGADMPLDELLKLYSQNGPVKNNSSQEEEEEDNEEDWESASDPDPDDRRQRFRQLLQANGQSLPDDDDDDSDDSSFEIEIIKVINVGDEYQAQVEAEAEFNSINGNSDDREVPVDELLWSPSPSNELDEEIIIGYLKTIRSEYPSSDDEISLQTLLQCQWDTTLAALQFRQLPVKTIYSYREWSIDEIQLFEEGLRDYGKNFHKISVSKCPTRTVRELVHYYYLWKKTERYQVFMEEQQRMNAITSVTDMIEKFIEEQEQQLCTAVGVVNPPNTSSYLSSDLKRQSPNSSISFVTIHQQETMKRSLDQVEHDGEPSAKKTALNPTNASTSGTIV